MAGAKVKTRYRYVCAVMVGGKKGFGIALIHGMWATYRENMYTTFLVATCSVIALLDKFYVYDSPHAHNPPPPLFFLRYMSLGSGVILVFLFAHAQTHSAFVDFVSSCQWQPGCMDLMGISCQFPVRSLMVQRQISLCVVSVVTNPQMAIYCGSTPILAPSIIERMKHDKKTRALCAFLLSAQKQFAKHFHHIHIM